LVKEIDDLVANLNKFKEAIQNGDEQQLHDLMEKGNKIKEEIG
jgi:prephenate dehydrogenase